MKTEQEENESMQFCRKCSKMIELEQEKELVYLRCTNVSIQLIIILQSMAFFIGWLMCGALS